MKNSTVPKTTAPNRSSSITSARWSVPAGPQELRVFVVDVGETHMQDYTYFETISSQMKHGGSEVVHTDRESSHCRLSPTS